MTCSADRVRNTEPDPPTGRRRPNTARSNVVSARPIVPDHQAVIPPPPPLQSDVADQPRVGRNPQRNSHLQRDHEGRIFEEQLKYILLRRADSLLELSAHASRTHQCLRRRTPGGHQRYRAPARTYSLDHEPQPARLASTRVAPGRASPAKWLAEKHQRPLKSANTASGRGDAGLPP